MRGPSSNSRTEKRWGGLRDRPWKKVCRCVNSRRWCRGIARPNDGLAAEPGVRQPGPDARRVEEALRRRLRTDVFVTPRGKGGRVSITFYSNEDLARLL